MKFKGKGEGWGMGFLLIFFPEEQHHPNHQSKKSPNLNRFSLPINRSNSSNLLLLKAQSTISICLLLLFVTALLFTLSTLPSSPSAARRLYRRHQLQTLNSNLSHALQKMGTLYRRGTKAMNDVVVAHVPEAVTPQVLKLFVRLFYRSSLAARSDLVFVFPAKLSDFDSVILHENDLFLKLLNQYGENLSNSSESSQGFDVTHFLKVNKKEKENAEPIWGRKYKANFSESGEPESSTLPSYGSVVSFDVDELDPENSLSGFLDHVPMSLRRWACYPMLLGRLRRNFKHVMLVDVKEMLLLGDPLIRVRSLSPESVILKLAAHSASGKHGRKSSARLKLVHPGFIMGGSRGIRRLSNEMLTVIVRAAMQRKKKNPMSESGLFNQLVGNDFVLKNVNLVAATESVPQLSSLSESSVTSGMRNFRVIRRVNGDLDFHNLVIKYLCSFPIDFTVYSDCYFVRT